LVLQASIEFAKKYSSPYWILPISLKLDDSFYWRVNQMASAIYPALSALRAFGQKLGVTAHNVANVNTDGFKKSRALLQEGSPSGVTVSISRVETPGAPLPPEDETQTPRESSNVEVEEEMVDLVTTKQAYTANLKTLKAEEEMLGTFLDILDE
jgi:flagellar basal body rod protein FlgG